LSVPDSGESRKADPANGEGGSGGSGPRRRWRGLPFGVRLFLLAGAAFTVGLASVNYVLMPLVVHRSGEVRVPDLVGLPAEEASSALEEVGLVMRTLGEAYDAEVPAGRVLRQDPEAGTSVRRNRSVSVLVSKGPDVATVPRLEGESLRHARMLLARLGLREGEIAHSFSPEVPADHVIGTDPPPGTSLKKGEGVSLLVSLGPRVRDYVMPDLRGLPLHETAASLEALGFAVRVKERGWTGFFRRSEPSIEKQRPLPGKRVRRGDEIELSP